MTHITLSDDQTRQLSEASAPIVFVDSLGRRLGELSSVNLGTREETISDEELAEVKRRMANDDGVRYTHAEMMERLRSLAPE